MRHNLLVCSLLDLTAIAVFSAGYWVDAAGLMALGIILFAAGLGFCLARFRCPCCHRYVGIIGYSKDMLDFYKNSDPGPLELAEGIDTLRFLDYGKPLYLIPVEKGESLSVDTPKDLEEVRKRSKNRELS